MFQAILPLTYSPLVVGETEDILEINNYLIGSYVYKVVTKCLPAKEKTLEVSTAFGTDIPIRLRVHNKTDTKAEFLSWVRIMFLFILLLLLYTSFFFIASLEISLSH